MGQTAARNGVAVFCVAWYDEREGVMTMRIGYACRARAVPGSALKSCVLKNATEERLLTLIAENLDALCAMIDYNRKNGIALYRISSDLIPFGSSSAAPLPWEGLFAEKWRQIGDAIRSAGMRVSMHPGQYTHLTSPNPAVVANAVEDLAYHARVLDALGTGQDAKIILHLGGAYGDKQSAKARFLGRFSKLDSTIKARLVLENDDSIYDIGDILEVANAAGIPAVFDSLHNAIHPADTDTPEIEWIRRCADTWKTGDGRQKIHYSQQNPEKKPGAHSDTIAVDAFLAFAARVACLNPDIMLEVKDKNQSAVKCLNCTSDRGIAALESDWARYKYIVLEKSPAAYRAIRLLLRDKTAYPAVELYRMTEDALQKPTEIGNAVNAAQHVFGYFNKTATAAEKRRFSGLLDKYASGTGRLSPVVNHLHLLAVRYDERYLLESYYFDAR